jgi:nitrite reductase/ring-hydroxylating ferredoxin subunit
MRVRACALSELAPNAVLRLELPDGAPVAVYRLDDGYYATDENCTHKWASLAAGHIEGGYIVCPWHGGAFDIRTGRAAAPPCVKALATYPVEIEGDALFVVVMQASGPGGAA